MLWNIQIPKCNNPNIKKIKPQIVLINLGGGTQEVLGSYLKNNLNYVSRVLENYSGEVWRSPRRSLIIF